ncbi:hypothetical protein D3C78_1634160 [compost metagenome]
MVLLSASPILRGLFVFLPLQLSRLLAKEAVVGSPIIVRHVQSTEHVIQVGVRETEAYEQECLRNQIPTQGCYKGFVALVVFLVLRLIENGSTWRRHVTVHFVNDGVTLGASGN